jgi:peptide/nickel transport system substrate-binding protein
MPKKGGHMRMAMGHGATTDTLDPATLTNGLQWVVAYGVANTLTELDASGALVGSLATEWSSSADAATWTFKLRKGVEFHNGKTMTAKDVKMSSRRSTIIVARNPPRSPSRWWPRSPISRPMATIPS